MPHVALFRNYKALRRLYEDGAVFCAFDTETTGLNAQTDRVIEIGAVRFSSRGVLDRFDRLINPEIPLPAICAELSHITDDMVRSSPVARDVLPEFFRFAGAAMLVAHNAPFDVKFVNAESERAGLSPLSNQVVDTLSFSRAVLPKNGHWSLQHLARQFCIPVHAAHRADDDARVCMEVLVRLLDGQFLS